MATPALALLRSIAQLSNDPIQVRLDSHADPSVDLRWMLTLARGS
jgi:hypothetical protein